MKLKEKINVYRKEVIFENYTKIINDFKEYEKISKNKIADEIIKLYSDYNIIIDLCSNDELKLLKKIINKKISPQKIFNEKLWHSLFEKFLLIHDNSNNEVKLVIPDEFKDSIKKAIKSYNEEEKIALDSLNSLLIGIIKIYGALKINNYYNIVKKYININKNTFIDFIYNNRFFKYYTYKIEYSNNVYIIYEPYYYFEDDLLYMVNYNKNKFKYKIRPIDEVLCLSFSKFNHNNPKIDEFLDAIYNLHFYQENFLNKVLEYSVLDFKRDDLIDYLKSIPILKNEDLSNVIQLMYDAMDEMPSASLKGMTPNEYIEIIVKKESDTKYNKVYNNIKDKESIDNYKKTREEVSIIYDECIKKLFENKNKIDKYIDILSKNNININEENVIRNLILFHKIDNEDNIFELVMKEKNILMKDFALFSQFEDSYLESLFQVKSLNPSLGQVTIKDMYTNKLYTFYDIALTCYDDVIDKYMYTSLVKIGNYMFSTDYAFVITPNKNILKIIDDNMKEIKNVKNENTKRFLACYKLYKQENICFTYRMLE